MADREVDVEDEGDRSSSFRGLFGSRKKVQDRLAAERKAGLTAKQRAARNEKAPPKQQVNFRASAETKARLEALAKLLNKSTTGTIELATEELAKAKGPGITE
jgi:hypothetical protein